MALTRPRYSQIYDTDWKQSVEVATVGSDVGNLFAGNLQPSTLDSVSLGIGNRILVKDQTSGAQNGLYVVRSVGTGSNGWWVRTLDSNQNSFVTSGLTVVVAQGTINVGQEFRLITPDPITLNTTSLSFLRISGVPGGANTQVQFADGIVLGGSPGFTFNKTSNTVNISGNILASTGTFNALTVGGFINTIGNISTAALTAGQINTTGNVVAQAGIFNSVVTNGTETVQQLNSTGNVLAVSFVGSGSLLTTLPGYAYSNVNVKAYTESMGFQNYGNANVTSYTISMGFTNFSNVNVVAYTQTQSYTNYSNVNVAAYTQTQSFTNYSNVNLAAYLGGAVTIGGNLIVQSNLNVTGNVYSNSGTDPLGYIYTMDDLASQFDGQNRSFTISVNDGTVYSVKNPNQISLQIGGVSIAPTRYIIDYQNLTEVSVFNRGFYLQTGSVAANASIITGNNFSTGGNVITFATAPSVGMSFYGTVRTNSDPIAAFTFKQSPFTALNIMLGS
jgi:hypothetical protein